MAYSVPMALVDYVPVFCFLAAAVILQRELYHGMSKGAFALFAAGTIDVFCAGFLKATYKLLYAANICDFEKLSAMFFPVQSIGFLLAGLGVVAMLCHRQGERTRLQAIAPVPAVFSGTFLFVGLMVAGLGMMDAGLMVLAGRRKRYGVIALLAVSFVCSLGMGYLSTKDFALASMNWIAECVNVAGQGAFLAAALLLKRRDSAKADGCA